MSLKEPETHTDRRRRIVDSASRNQTDLECLALKTDGVSELTDTLPVTPASLHYGIYRVLEKCLD